MVAVIWDATTLLYGKFPTTTDFIPENLDDAKWMAEYGNWLGEKNELIKAKLLAILIDRSDIICGGDCRPESVKRLETALYKMENLADGIGKKRAEMQAQGWNILTYLDRFKKFNQLGIPRNGHGRG